MRLHERVERCSSPQAGEEIARWDEPGSLARILCRLEGLKRAGCEQPDCAVLAGRLDVDLERALALIGRGCSPALAVRILA